MPSQKRRKQIHWEKVEKRKQKEQERIESIVPETIEAQICKPLHAPSSVVEDSYEFVERSTLSKRDVFCSIQ